MVNSPLSQHPPYKSVAIALLLSALLGPIGLLYASFWGGCIMIVLGFIVFSSQVYYSAAIIWVVCCVWSVGAVEAYNKQVFKTLIPNDPSCEKK